MTQKNLLAIFPAECKYSERQKHLVMKSLLVPRFTMEPMTAEGSLKDATARASLAGSPASPPQAMVAIAERELERALLERSPPATRMYAHPSAAEEAAMRRAVHAICVEAHRLGLRAEELVIGIKQAWPGLAHVRARCLGDADRDVLREVVSSSIKVFFGTREESADDRRY